MSTKKHKKKSGVLDKKNLAVVVTATAFIAFIAYGLSALAPRKAETTDIGEAESYTAMTDSDATDTGYETGLVEVYEESAIATTAEAVPTEQTTEEKAETQSNESIFSLPINGEIINDYSGGELVYSETMDDWRTHNGIDYSANEGDIVVAAADGTVEAVTENSMLGKTVIMLHKNGIRTIYANLADKNVVEEGIEIPAGTAIGMVGTTAALEVAMPPHLHFEMSLNEETVNPHDYIGK